MTLQNVENFTVFFGADFLRKLTLPFKLKGKVASACKMQGFKTGLRRFKIAMERMEL
jgi:hypothetical protein